ncbi:HARB1 nuclease, partial [Amia calva]|nr:HARB1 nuclease [Amia calva]
NATRRIDALTVEQTVCLAVRYFASGHFMYPIGDAEYLSRNTMCHAARKVALALSKLLDGFAVFSGHLSMLKIKEAFYGIAGRFDGLQLGDRGYPCLRYLMTPYPDPQTREQIKYNMAHSNTRVRIEMTFGVIKARFACLQGLWVCVERACEVVAACVVLHNIATIRKERAPCQLPMPPDVVDPVTLDHPTGRAVREAITNQFFTQSEETHENILY